MPLFFCIAVSVEKFLGHRRHGYDRGVRRRRAAYRGRVRRWWVPHIPSTGYGVLLRKSLPDRPLPSHPLRGLRFAWAACSSTASVLHIDHEYRSSVREASGLRGFVRISCGICLQKTAKNQNQKSGKNVQVYYVICNKTTVSNL